MSAEEKEQFLEDAGDHISNINGGSVRHKTKKTWMLAASVVLNAILFTLCVALSISSWRAQLGEGIASSRKGSNLAEPYSPANVAIEYEYRSVIGNDSRFTGHPGPLWEYSMDKLLDGTLIRFSKEELEMAGTESVPLKDGGFAGSIGVAHSLHCVKRLKQYLYPDYFYPGVDRDSKEMTDHRDHADHCLDWIRQGVMCYVDSSVYTLAEISDDHTDSMNNRHKLPGVQKCVNWEVLHDWMASRAANIHDIIREPS